MIQINSTLQNQLLIGCFAIFLSACSSIEMQTDMQSSPYNVVIHRDFWGIPYIRGETDLDVAYGIGLSHAEDSYDDLVELMPLYRGESALFQWFERIGDRLSGEAAACPSKCRGNCKKSTFRKIT